MVTVTLAPDDEGSGVYVSVPAPSTAGGVVNSPLSLGEIDTAKETVCPDSFGGPALPVVHPVTVCGPADAETFWSGPTVKLGASFTGVIVIVTVATLELSAPSLA